MIEGHFENGLIKGKATFYPNDDEPYEINTEEDDENENFHSSNSTMENTCANINEGN